MPTTFDLFFLGIAPEIDSVEGNLISENHGALETLTFGSSSDPLALNIRTFSPDAANSYTGGAASTAYDANNALAPENFVIDGVTRTHDATMTAHSRARISLISRASPMPMASRSAWPM
jgi:hypothetical protein